MKNIELFCKIISISSFDNYQQITIEDIMIETSSDKSLVFLGDSDKIQEKSSLNYIYVLDYLSDEYQDYILDEFDLYKKIREGYLWKK